jgi:hypothetical protein
MKPANLHQPQYPAVCASVTLLNTLGLLLLPIAQATAQSPSRNCSARALAVAADSAGRKQATRRVWSGAIDRFVLCERTGVPFLEKAWLATNEDPAYWEHLVYRTNDVDSRALLAILPSIALSADRPRLVRVSALAALSGQISTQGSFDSSADLLKAVRRQSAFSIRSEVPRTKSRRSSADLERVGAALEELARSSTDTELSDAAAWLLAVNGLGSDTWLIDWRTNKVRSFSGRLRTRKDSIRAMRDTAALK